MEQMAHKVQQERKDQQAQMAHKVQQDQQVLMD